MSQKLFCDACGAELVRAEDNVATSPMMNGSGGVTVEVVAGFNGPRQGEVCRSCVIDAVMALDTRMPRPQSAGEKQRIQVARQMANVIFNLSQIKNQLVDDAARESMHKLWREWDEAVKA